MNQRNVVYQEKRRQYIPQENMNQNEVIYEEESGEFSNQINNNINESHMNYGSEFCPIHGLKNRIIRQQGFEGQGQIRKYTNRKF